MSWLTCRRCDDSLRAFAPFLRVKASFARGWRGSARVPDASGSSRSNSAVDSRAGRLSLVLPPLADDGNAVAMRISMAGPFAEGADVSSVALFSEKNPVPKMAEFGFPVPPPKVEIESRVRLAGSQRVTAVAVLVDGTVHAATADVVVL